MNEIETAIEAAKAAMESRPKWTGSWYAIGRAIQELERAATMAGAEKQFEPGTKVENTPLVEREFPLHRPNIGSDRLPK